MQRAVLLSALLFVAACGAPTPIVSDYNGSAVKIQLSSLIDGSRNDETDAEATRICKAGGKGRAEYASSRDMGDYNMEHLYLCLN
jgi:hypothetical protein